MEAFPAGSSRRYRRGGRRAPGYHLATVTLDMAALVRKIGRASWGVGYLMDRGGENLVDPADDLFVILGMWSGEMAEHHCEGIAASAAGLGFLVAGQSYPSFAAAAIANALGSAAGNAAAAVLGNTAAEAVAKNVKMGSIPALQKVARKIAIKLLGKGGGKILSGFIPFLGAAIGSSINVYLLKTVMVTAEIYYARKHAAIDTRG